MCRNALFLDKKYVWMHGMNHDSRSNFWENRGNGIFSQFLQNDFFFVLVVKDKNFESDVMIAHTRWHATWFLASRNLFSIFLSEGYLPLTPKINANSGKPRFSRFLLGDGKIGTFWYVCIRMNFSGFEALAIIENHYITNCTYYFFLCTYCFPVIQ